jgi:acyl-CoA thioester hydrolase
VVWVVRHIEIGYRASAKLDDLLDVRTEIAECGKTSLTIKQTILRSNKVLAEVTVVVVAITSEGKPVLFPPQLRQIFER